MNFRLKNGTTLSPMGSKLKRIQALPGVNKDETTTKGQHEDGTMSPVYDDLTVNGTFTASALVVDSVAPAITAKAGGGQDATLALSKNLNIVTTVATAADSVTLPAAAAGQRITIVNLGANTLAVFPYTSDSINDEAANASVTQDPETTVTYNCYTGVLWESDNESLDAFDKVYVGNGTVALPAFTFASDKDSGIYSIGANNIGIAAGGSKILDIGGASALGVTGGISATTTVGATTALSYGTLLTEGVTTGITAFAGGGQASATALTTSVNNVTVCATAGDSVKLPAAAAGLTVTIKNSGATALDIFPASADSIDALAVNLAVRIAPLSVATFRAIDGTVWESNIDASFTLSAPSTAKGQLQILAADSAGNTVTTITNASQAAARTYTVPDAGGNASFVMTSSVGSVTGARCTTQFDAVSGTTGTTLTNVVGMSVSLIAGATYTVDVYIGGTSTANSGLKLALAGTATWTSTDATAAYYTASAVAVGHNATATPGTAIGGTTAANIYATIKATIVVNAAGTLTLQAAQNASHVDTTSVYVNSYINATRIA